MTTLFTYHTIMGPLSTFGLIANILAVLGVCFAALKTLRTLWLARDDLKRLQDKTVHLEDIVDELRVLIIAESPPSKAIVHNIKNTDVLVQRVRALVQKCSSSTKVTGTLSDLTQVHLISDEIDQVRSRLLDFVAV